MRVGERFELSKIIVSGIMLTLLLVGMFTLVFNIQPVRASETIYIRADGSIDPSTANITTSDFVTYNFTNDNYGSIVVQRSNVIIDGKGYRLQGSGTGIGFNIVFVNYVTVRNTSINGFQIGVHLQGSYAHDLYGNEITGNNQYGIYVFESYVTISENNITENSQKGIYLTEHTCGSITDNNVANGIAIDTSSMTIYRNNITGGINAYSLSESGNYENILENNLTGTIHLDGWELDASINGNNIKGGIVLSRGGASISGNNIQGGIKVYSALASISANSIASNYSDTGIYIYVDRYYLSEPPQIEIFKNNICENQVGISLIGMSPNFGCSIYHNNYIDNIHQVGNVTVSEVAWDDGYPSGGNYWSDYNGTDLYSGPYQNETESDEIGDTPYTIDENNTDNYPLMSPYKGHDIAVEYIEINKTIVAQGTIQKIDVKVVNHGPFPQTFNLIVYANDTIIQTLLVYLAPRAHATIRFYWETSAQPYGNYNITAYAGPVSDETDTTDNTCLGSVVTVTIPGDVDGDFDVDLYDAVKLLTHYGAKAGQPAYDPVCDIDGNGNIDLYDATELLTNYGQKYP